MTDQNGDAIRGSLLLKACAAGLMYCVLALACIFLARASGIGNVAFVWLPNAVAVALLYRSSHRQWLALLLAMFAGNTVASLVAGDHLTLSVGLSVANTVEVVLAALLIGRFFPVLKPLNVNNALGVLLIGIGIASPVGAALGATIVAYLSGAVWWNVAESWWVGDVVGMMTLLLPGLVLNPADYRQWQSWSRLSLFLGCYLGCLFVSIFALLHLSFPFVFMLVPITLFAINYGAASVALLCNLLASTLTVVLLTHWVELPPLFASTTILEILVAGALMNFFPYFVGIITDAMREREQQLTQARNAYRSSDEKLRALFELSSVGIARNTTDGRYIDVNPALLEMVGYTDDELRQLSYWDLTPKDYDHQEWLQLQSLEKNGRYGPYEKEYLHHDGRRIPVRLNGVMVSGDDGQRYIWSTIEDVSTGKIFEAQLKDARDTLQTIIDNAPAMIGYWDTDLHNRFGNKAYVDWFGMSPEDMHGKHIRDVIGERLYQLNKPHLDSALAGNNVLFEREIVDPTGFKRTSLASYVPDIENGSVKGIYVFVTDVTQISQAQQAQMEAQAKLQNVINAASEFTIIATDLHGTIQLFSHGAEKMLGYCADDVVGKLTPAIIHLPEEVQKRSQELSAEYGRTIEGFDVFVELVRHGGAEAREWTFVRKNGSRIPVNLVVTAIRDEADCVTGFLGIAKDITQEKLAQETLSLAKEQAEMANRAKSDFVANMSHEIRTPMNAVLGMTNLLAKTELTEKQRKYLEMIQAAGKTLMGILNDILDFSKIEAGKMLLVPAEFELDKLLAGISTQMTAQIDKKALKTSIIKAPDTPSLLVGDALRLQQLLGNLVSNAIKFTEHGEVQVTVGVHEKAASRITLRFSVIDTGIGISTEEQAQLFRPFTQADTSITRRFGGTGLGLAISKRIIDLMGGEIQVVSELGKGSEFWCLVPFEYTHAAPEPVAAIAAAAVAADVVDDRHKNAWHGVLKGVNILVVEDNEMNQMVTCGVLEQAGARYHLVCDGQQAVDHLRQQPQTYDLVLMDVQMPVMDGFTATRQIREQLGLKLPVIALTAGVMASERDSCLASGMNDFIAKPTDIKQMMAVICGQLPTKSTAGTEPPPATPPADSSEISAVSFNPEKLLAMLQGNDNFRQEIVVIVRRLVIAAPLSIDEARQAVSNGDPQAAARIFHKMRGTVSSLGAQALSDLSLKIESKLRSGDLSHLESLFLAIDRELTCMITAAQQWLSEQSDSEVVSNAIMTLDNNVLRRLLKLLAEKNMEACDVYTTLRPTLAGLLAVDLLADLDQAMDGLDFGRAQLVLKPLRTA